MSGLRPKLVLRGGSEEDARAIREALGSHYDLLVEPPIDPTDPESGKTIEGDHAKTLLACLDEGACLGSSEGRILWANRFFRALSSACQGRIESLARDAANHLAQSIDAGATLNDKLCCKFEAEDDDSGRSFDVFVTPVPGPSAEENTLHGVAILVRDVTETRSAKRKMDAIDRAGYELVRLDTEELRKRNAYERLALLEDRIVKTTREVLHYDHFAVFLIDQKRRKLELIVSSGLPESIQDLDLYLESEGSGISGYVANTGVSYICHNAETDDRFLPGLSGANSSLTVPLRIQDKVIGVMDIESVRPRAFSDEDRQFVEIFARHIALALHMLDLLVAERSTTNMDVSGRFEGELNEPLEDIVSEIGWLRSAAHDDETAAHIAQIMSDVESIRSRMRDVASGPQTILGVDRALHQRGSDPVLEGRRILVADDSPKIRKVIGEILSHRGALVSVCESGQQAIDLLARDAHDPDTSGFDLIISDIQMPDRNGYEVFSAARRDSPDAKVILMTGFGYDPHHSIVRASQEGLQSVLFKPFEFDALLVQIREALSEPGKA